MTNLKPMSRMTVTSGGKTRALTSREMVLVRTFVYPFVSRSIARSLRSQYPEADREEIAHLMRADLGDDPDPEALTLMNLVLDRLPPRGSRASVLASARSSPSALVLILANLVPAWGVLVLGWDVFPIVLLFWLENVIIGVLNVARMVCVDPGDAAIWIAKLFMVPFFCVHYGMFTMIHGVFVFALFGGDRYTQSNRLSELPDMALQAISDWKLGLSVLVLAGSHLFSFAWNYLGQGEYRIASVAQLMGRPYGRVVVLHIGILLGGFLVSLLDSPKWALLLLLGFKVAYDLYAHQHEHRAAAERAS